MKYNRSMGVNRRLQLTVTYAQPPPFDVAEALERNLRYVGQRYSVDVVQEELGYSLDAQTLAARAERELDQEKADELYATNLCRLTQALALSEESREASAENASESSIVLLVADEAVEMVTLAALHVWELLSQTPEIADETESSVEKVLHYVNINPHVDEDGSGFLSERNCSGEDCYGDWVIDEDVTDQLGPIACKITERGPQYRTVLQDLGEYWQEYTGLTDRHVIYDGVLVLMTLASVTGVPAVANPAFLPHNFRQFVEALNGRLTEQCINQ
jgi:hypothetical protein